MPEPEPEPEPEPALGVGVPEEEIGVALEEGTPEVVEVGVVMLAGGLQADPSAMVYRPGTTFQQPLVEIPEREKGKKEIIKVSFMCCLKQRRVKSLLH